MSVQTISPATAATDELPTVTQVVPSVETWNVTVTEVRVDGNIAWTRGEYTSEFVNKSDGKSPWGVEQGKFLFIWQRQGDGTWKIVLDMGNSNGGSP